MQCQDDRSQHKNKEKALQILKSRLKEKQERAKSISRFRAVRKLDQGIGQKKLEPTITLKIELRITELMPPFTI